MALQYPLNTQKVAYRYPLPPVRSDFEEHRRRAITEAYRHALGSNLFPIERPKVDYVPGDGFITLAVERAYLEVTVLCAP